MNHRRLLSYAFLASLITLTTLTCGWCKVVYVKTTGNDSNNGLSWATAKKTVSAGITASVSGDEVWVASGTYLEAITLKAGTALYGGFAGSETARSQRDSKANVCVLDARAYGATVTSPPSADVTTVIDGFTLQNGSQNIVYCSGSSPTISNNVITGKKNTSAVRGIYCLNCSPSIVGNYITRNLCTDIAAGYGGGIYLSNSSPVIRRNTIVANGAERGAAVYCEKNSNATISGNVICANDGPSGGGIYCSASSPTIVGNSIAGNSAGTGGGICCYASSPSIANNIIALNSSGIYVSSGSPTLQNNDVYNPGGYDYSGLSAGNGDFSADPKFAGLLYGNLHIQPDSLCRDAGWNAALGQSDIDIDGQPRVQPTDGNVDVGADESDSTTWTATPVIVRVDPISGNDANDGSTWASAKKTLQSAVDKASSSGGEVWAKAGSYTAAFALGPFAYVYGGFMGGESTRDARDWKANATVISNTTITATAIGYRLASTDGFVITSGPDTNKGIRCSYASPQLSNNTLKGGGSRIYCDRGSYPEISGSTITGFNNSSVHGGAIYCESTSGPAIRNNALSNNAADFGGAVYCMTFSSATISNNLILGNTARCGGGIYCYTNSTVTITNNTIAANRALDGSGVYSTGCSPSISNNLIAFNSSGIFASTGSPVLRNNDLFNPDGYNYSGLSAGTGDISADPVFANRQYGDFHIQPTSPCEDAGWNEAPYLGSVDVDGQPRISTPDGIVDIGADESDGRTRTSSSVVMHVNGTNGNDAYDGLSWSSPKKTIQSAIDVASMAGGDVWVARGVYLGQIKPARYVHLFGGFDGSEMTREERNWRLRETVIDANAATSAVSFNNIGVGQGTLDGFTVRNGNTGGILCYYSSPTIVNDLVTNNIGAGIQCNTSSPTIVNNTITKNSGGTSAGGGIYCKLSSPLIANNVITANTPPANALDSAGAGIYCESSPANIVNNTILSNTFAGIYCKSGTQVPIISNNIVAFSPIGIGIDSYSSTLDLHNNCVYNPNGVQYYGISAGSTDISVDPELVSSSYGRRTLPMGRHVLTQGLMPPYGQTGPISTVVLAR